MILLLQQLFYLCAEFRWFSMQVRQHRYAPPTPSLKPPAKAYAGVSPRNTRRYPLNSFTAYPQSTEIPYTIVHEAKMLLCVHMRITSMPKHKYTRNKLTFPVVYHVTNGTGNVSGQYHISCTCRKRGTDMIHFCTFPYMIKNRKCQFFLVIHAHTHYV